MRAAACQACRPSVSSGSGLSEAAKVHGHASCAGLLHCEWVTQDLERQAETPVRAEALYQPGLTYPCGGRRAEGRLPAPTACARTTAESTVDIHFGSRRPSSDSSLVR